MPSDTPTTADPAPGSRTTRSPSRFRNGARAFRHHNYRRFFVGLLVSLIGTWMQQVAQAWLVLDLTNDPFVLGLVAAVAFLPVLVLGLFGGLIADALPKRRTLMVTQTVQMILAFILFGLTVTGTVQVWQILVLAALLGVTNAVDMPTRQAFTVEMVGREDVANAIALNAAVFNGSRVVGPAIAGLTIAFFGGDVSIAFLLNGLSFAAVIAAYAAMRDSELQAPPVMTRPHSVREVGHSLGEGLSYVRRTELVLLVVATVGLASTLGMNFGVTIPALAREVLGTDATGFGFLMTATGIGSLAAALLIAFSGRSRPAVVPLGATVLGVGLVASAFIDVYALALVAMLFVGFGAIAMAATANTTIQLAVPDELRGRVISIYATVFVGSTPIGGLLMGWIASSVSVEASLLVGGLGCVATGVAALAWMRHLRGAALFSPAVLPGRRVP
jgi:MFS family permease